MTIFIRAVVLFLLFVVSDDNVYAAQPEVSGPVKASMSVVPPRTILKTQGFDLRMGLINDTAATKTFSVQFYVNTESSFLRILAAPITAQVAAGQSTVVTADWRPGEYFAGDHTLLAVAYDELNNRLETSWDVSISTATSSKKVRALWFEPEALIYREAGWGESHIREMVRQMDGLGIELLIFSYVEYYGCYHYPVKGLDVDPYFDYDENKLLDPANKDERCYYDGHIDLLGVILDEAEKVGMHVLIGPGRGGDGPFFLDHYGWWQAALTGASSYKGVPLNQYITELSARLNTISSINLAVAKDVYEKYGHHQSFYGFYLSHEQNCMDYGANYYGYISPALKAATRPNFPVLIAPYGDVQNCLISAPVEQTINAMDLDILAPQDSVGPGWSEHSLTYTWNPWTTIPGVSARFAEHKQEIVDRAGKHMWATVEIWRMYDHPQRDTLGYGCWGEQLPCVAADFATEFLPQLDAVSPHVSMLTVNESIGYLAFEIPGFKFINSQRQLTADAFYSSFKQHQAEQGQ